MATNTLNLRISLCNKTAEQFNADSSTVWLKGEFLVESDTRKIKIGDGVNTYANLKYATLTPEEVQNLINAASHTHENKAVLDATTASFTTELLTKLNGIAEGAEVNVQADWNEADTNSDAFIKNKPTAMPASDVYDWAKQATKPSYTPEEVGADPSGSASNALNEAKGYTDTKVADLINGAPETLDTLKEVADAIEANGEVVTALNEAIGKKANASDLKVHTDNSDIHVTTDNKTQWDAAYTHSQQAHSPADAEKNIITTVKVNGSALTPDANRAVDVTVPTKVSELDNDAGYRTTDNDTTYTLGVSENSATNGNAKIRLTAGGSGTGTQDVTIKGSGATAVTTDAEGNIVVSSTDTQYTHPTHTAHASGLYKVTVDESGHVSAVTAVEKEDITGLGIPAQDTTYGAAGTDLGLVKSGGDVTIADGVITVNNASKLTTARSIAVSGGATGTATSFDGSKDISIPITELNAMYLKIAAGDTLILNGTV